MQNERLDEISVGLSPVPSGELVVRPLAANRRLAFSLVVPTRNESHNLVELSNSSNRRLPPRSETLTRSLWWTITARTERGRLPPI